MKQCIFYSLLNIIRN